MRGVPSRKVPSITPKPSGREDVVKAIVASAATLFAQRGPAAVSLREVAQHANVNFGLVYQYVGTKEQLVAKVLRESAADAAARFAEADDLDQALQRMMTTGDGTTARLLAWSVLEGRHAVAHFDQSPALGILAERARDDAERAGRSVTDEDARVLAAIAMVLATGWRLFGAAALGAAGLDASRQGRYDELVADCVRLLGRHAMGAPTEPPTPASERPPRSTRRK